jgi:hypothetical protein
MKVNTKRWVVTVNNIQINVQRKYRKWCFYTSFNFLCIFRKCFIHPILDVTLNSVNEQVWTVNQCKLALLEEAVLL